MTYVQYAIQARNFKLFESILSSNEGFEDFIKSRDAHGNNSMHYVALVDDEDLIEALINKVNWAPHVGK